MKQGLYDYVVLMLTMEAVGIGGGGLVEVFEVIGRDGRKGGIRMINSEILCLFLL